MTAKNFLLSTLHWVWVTVKILFIVILLFIVALFFKSIKIPSSWVDSATDRLSSGGVLVKCSGASFGFSRGLELGAIRVYDSTKSNCLEAIASARRVNISPWGREVKVVEAKYKRLPASYYSTEAAPYQAPDLDFELPKLPEFRLVLDRPEILGIAPARVTAQVAVKPRSLNFDEVHVDWPERDPRVAVDGCCRLDFDAAKLRADVRGFALQYHIRPLLEVLDVPVAFPYFDGFTEVTNAVSARGEFDADFISGEFKMRLDLAPELGRYNGVRMASAKGSIDLQTWPGPGGAYDSRLTVDLPYSVDPEGRKLTGTLGVTTTGGVSRVSLDIKSELEFKSLLKIVDYFDPEDFDDIAFDSAPRITARGHFGTSAADIEWHDLSGEVFLRRGQVRGMPLKNLAFDWDFKRDVFSLNRLRAVCKRGGLLSGRAAVDFHSFDDTNTTFDAALQLSDGQLDELADVYGVDLAGRDGKLNLSVEASGLLASNAWRRLNGKGSVRVSEGHLLQMNLFAGLTELLAEKVPGVEYIVNQSDASTDFTIEDGVFKSDNIFLEGGLISLKGWGGYDLAEDRMDFTVRVQFLKNDSLMGKILHPITFPLTKMLLEFRADGSLEDPSWGYITLLDRVF